jgi:hypothetical protein
VRPGTAAPSRNAFSATLSGARAVRLDLARMRIQTSRAVSGDLDTQAPVRLELLGKWRRPEATLDSASVPVTRVADGVIAIEIPAGRHSLAID